MKDILASSSFVPTALIVLGVLAALLLLLIVACRFTEFSLLQRIYYGIAWLMTRLQWGAKYDGQFDLPRAGGGIVICNHRSSVDPFFIQTHSRRKIRWMVAKEYVSSWALAWFLKPCEVIPVGRGGVDTAATKTAFRAIEAGGIIGMLPEGRINTTKEPLLPVRPGAALVALKLKVPVIPCFIENSPYNKTAWSPLFMTARVKVHFGPQVDLGDLYGREDEDGVVNEAILRCARAMLKLAGRSDVEPQLAGRKWKPE